jgi:hypothetical protein
MLTKTVDRGATDRRIDAYQGAIDALLVFYAPDVLCHPAPGWVEEERCHGHEGIRRLSAVWADGVTDPMVEIHQVRDLGERVLVLARLTGRDSVSAAEVEQRFGLVNSDLRADGTVGEVRFFLHWEDVLRAVGLAGEGG